MCMKNRNAALAGLNFIAAAAATANNLQYAGDILKPHKLSCALEQKRLECAIMIKAALAQPEE